MNHRSSTKAARLLLAAAVSGIVLVAPAPAEAQATKKVVIFEGDPDNAKTWGFKPADITIPAGTTIVWEWQADDKHSATADNGAFDSGEKQGRGTTWSYRFTKAGQYPYSCLPHPYMFGQINVTG